MKILYFGNCQAEALARIHKALRPDDEVVSVLNYIRSGQDLINELVQKSTAATVLVYQPAGRRVLVETPTLNGVLKSLYPLKVSFPLIYNNALWTFFPNGAEVAFADAVRAQAEDADEAWEKFTQGKLVFEFGTRWAHTMSELRWRERETDCVISPTIESLYRKTPIFWTQNHPTFPVLVEVTKQVFSHLSLPFEDRPTLCLEIGTRLYDSSLLWIHSGYDVEAHELTYGNGGFHSNWHHDLIEEIYK